MYFTTSWDDGSVHDTRLADLLSEHGIRGTFYIPVKNREISSLLSPASIRSLSANFETGGHTYSHCILTEVPEKTAEEEIKKGKEALENITGKSLSAFCFPRGKYRTIHVRMMRDAGFLFGRTVSNFHTGKLMRNENKLMDVSIQFYPHKNTVYLRNTLLEGNFEGWRNFMSASVKARGAFSLHRELLSLALGRKGCFHLWGHSWEIEKYGLWDELSSFLKHVSSLPEVVHCTNTELAEISGSTYKRTS